MEDVETAVRQELDGPGQLLGYCALHKVIREKHELAVPRQLVYDVMTNVDSEVLEQRRVDKCKQPRGPTGTFTSMVGKQNNLQLIGVNRLGIWFISITICY